MESEMKVNHNDIVQSGEEYETWTDALAKKILAEEIAQDRAIEEAEHGKKKRLPDGGKGKDDNHKIINYLYVGKGLWYWLRDTSNHHGVKMEAFIAHLLETARRTWKPPGEESNLVVHLNWLRVQSDAYSDAYEDAYATAVNCKNHPTEENAIRLGAACERLAIDPQELLSRVQEDRFSEIAAEYNSDPETKMNRCVRHIVEFCRDHEGEKILSQAFNEAIETMGFSRQMVYSARRKVGIKSENQGGKHYLVLPRGTSVFYGKVAE